MRLVYMATHKNLKAMFQDGISNIFNRHYFFGAWIEVYTKM